MEKETENKTVIEEPEIPLCIVQKPKPEEKFDRWLPHVNGQLVECKLWQIIPCNFQFFFGGRIITGPGKPYWIYIVVILLGVTCSFVVFDVLPYYDSWTDGIIGYAVAFSALLGIINLFRVVTTEPGYMLPNWFSKEPSELLLTQQLTYLEITEKYGYTSYCCVCKIFQKPDTYHCRECHACIDGGDHHCSLLGTCVGKRNYGAFIAFILFTNFGLWLATVVSIIHLVFNWIDLGPRFAFGQSITLYLILSTLALPPGGLYVISALPFFHLRLIYYGLTLEQEKTDSLIENNTSDFKCNQKLLQFIKNFYNRVMKSAPSSQIPFHVLQLTVKMTAIPRTEVVSMYHTSMQDRFLIRRVKIRYRSSWMESMFIKYRTRLIQRDLDLYGPLSVSIDQMMENKPMRTTAAKLSPTNSAQTPSRIHTIGVTFPRFLLRKVKTGVTLPLRFLRHSIPTVKPVSSKVGVDLGTGTVSKNSRDNAKDTGMV